MTSSDRTNSGSVIAHPGPGQEDYMNWFITDDETNQEFKRFLKKDIEERGLGPRWEFEHDEFINGEHGRFPLLYRQLDASGNMLKVRSFPNEALLDCGLTVSIANDSQGREAFGRLDRQPFSSRT